MKTNIIDMATTYGFKVSTNNNHHVTMIRESKIVGLEDVIVWDSKNDDISYGRRIEKPTNVVIDDIIYPIWEGKSDESETQLYYF